MNVFLSLVLALTPMTGDHTTNPVVWILLMAVALLALIVILIETARRKRAEKARLKRVAKARAAKEQLEAMRQEHTRNAGAQGEHAGGFNDQPKER